uniref:DNA-directed RNA polymerase III subunit n=1 Tax=Odontella aurita TaxID=265563 RepID=A0A7S4JJ13_9STRA|mmetsp:Transcript_47186/g.142889  ORF Transcript_47186/g.142889 Transcript_47186/m.142889 type:complete len:144 (+) Transcript_47186:561-992(+)
MQNSAFYVRPTKDVPDVIRHSDRKRPPSQIDASTVLSHCLGGRKKTKVGRFVPEELVKGQNLGGPGAGAGGGISSAKDAEKAVNLNELAALEKQRVAEEEEGEGEENLDQQDDEEEDDGADYVANYYESEGDESDGGDGEATF